MKSLEKEPRVRFRDILYNNEQLGPFPMHLLRHVERPTNHIVGPIERRDHRETAFAQAARGDFGEKIRREMLRLTKRYPIGGALMDIQDFINTIKGHRIQTAPKRAPIPDDPRVRSRHLKSLGYFLGANYKASCVLTDMELEVDGPVDFGLQEYCANCDICAKQCPSGAVSKGGQILYNGYYTWKLNTTACSNFDILNKEGCVCGRCTKVCPWTRPGSRPEDFAGWGGSLEELYKGVEAQRKILEKNNYVDPLEATHKWWFELDEDIDGNLVVPTGVNKHRFCREYPLAKKPTM